jgi:hypothetical protein
MKLVDTFDDLFQELFTINLSHRGFDSLNESMICDHVKIKPDKNTKKIMKDHRINYHFDDDNFVCYMQAKLLAPPALTPKGAYIIPASIVFLRFLLDVSKYFMDATEIEPTATGRAYYFSNRTNAGTGMFISHDAADVNSHDLSNIPGIDVKEKYIGVIDIFCSGAMNNSYELFTGASGQLKSPQYRLSFRSTL